MHERVSSGAEMLVCVALRPAVFKKQGRRKSEMHQMAPNWTWPVNSQMYAIYT